MQQRQFPGVQPALLVPGLYIFTGSDVGVAVFPCCLQLGQVTALKAAGCSWSKLLIVNIQLES